MDASVVLKLDRVIEQLNSLKDNSESMATPLEKDIDNQIWFDDVEQLEHAIKLIEILKQNQDDIAECLSYYPSMEKDLKQRQRIYFH